MTVLSQLINDALNHQGGHIRTDGNGDITQFIPVEPAAVRYLSMNDVLTPKGGKQTTFNAFLAVGMLLCLITAGIDLSVGANAVFCACIMGAMKQAGVSSGLLMMLAAIAAGGLFGFINGTLLKLDTEMINEALRKTRVRLAALS